MVQQVLWGEMSANALERLMSLFMVDIRVAAKGKLAVKPIKKISSLGDSGALQNHVWRDLCRMLPEPNIPLHWMSCPFYHIQLGEFTRTLHHISLHPWVTTHKQS